MSWSPLDNLDIHKYFPNTPSIKYTNIDSKFKFDQSLYPDYTMLKNENARIILVKGYLGGWMRGHFKSVKKHFEAQDLQVEIAPVATGKSILFNVDKLKKYFDSLDRNLYLFCHSKGGVEVLYTLFKYPELHEKIKGIILVQTPHATSKVLESVFQRRHIVNIFTRIKEKLMFFSLNLMGASKGAKDLVSPGLDSYLLNYSFAFPILHFFTWSIKPTSWLDSYHTRLNEIAPGVAHDGQFYAHEMIWPDLKNIMIGGIDHAQPVVGGDGFNPARFWEVCLGQLLKE